MNVTAYLQFKDSKRHSDFDFDKHDINDELADLLAKVAHEDRAAFATLYERSSVRLYGIVNKILGRQQLSSDALQEVYVKIWLNASKFDPRLGVPLTWMGVIARRQALDIARRSQHLWLADELDDEHPSGEIGVLETCLHSDTLRTLLLCLAKLDDNKRELLMYAYYRGASRKALSHRFDIPVPTVKTQLRRFLAELKELMTSS